MNMIRKKKGKKAGRRATHINIYTKYAFLLFVAKPTTEPPDNASNLFIGRGEGRGDEALPAKSTSEGSICFAIIAASPKMGADSCRSHDFEGFPPIYPKLNDGPNLDHDRAH